LRNSAAGRARTLPALSRLLDEYLSQRSVLTVVFEIGTRVNSNFRFVRDPLNIEECGDLGIQGSLVQ